MKKLLLLGLIANSAWAVCTTSITSPTAASVQSGVVNWTRSVAGCPTGITTEWILDDFYSIGLVSDPSGTLANYNTGTPTDGPFNVKVKIRDGANNLLTTSANVPFVIQNFGIGSTISVTSLTSASGDVTATYNQTPTVSGTLSFDWRTSHSPSTNIVHTTFAFDSQQLPTDTSLPPHTTFDTTQVINGIHLVWSIGYCVQTDTTCGGVIGGPIPRILIAFTVNVQNGTTLLGVQPNVENVSLTVGQTFSLSPVLARTDGTTTSGTFDYTLNFSCNLAERSQAQIPFQCVTGNANPPTSAQGAAYISLSCVSSCASPVAITANSLGLTFVTITDHASSKARVIEVDVRDTLAIRHFGKCGAIYSTFVPSGACPSIIRTSIENAGFGNDTFYKNEYVKAGYTAWEGQFYQQPQAYASFPAWQAAENTNYLNPITAQLSAMPGLCMVLRGENYTQHPADSIEAQQGPSASWLPADPLLFSLQQLALTQSICGAEQRDEADQGLGFNPAFAMKFSDSSINKVVCKTHTCMVYPGTSGLYPTSPIYNFGGTTVGATTFIRNATTTALNGLNTTSCAFVSDWDAWLSGTAYCTDPNTSAPVPDSFTFTNASVADGTYNVSTDPNLEILGYGAYTGYAGQQELNNNYQYIVGKFRTTSTPQTWPVLGGTSFKSNLYYFGNTMSDYMTLFQSYAGGTDQAKGTGLPWGNSFWQYYSGDIFKKWGGFPNLGNLLVNSGSGKGWQTSGAGNQYSTHNQSVPVIGFLAMSAMTYNMGGVNNSIVNMNGSTLTTAAPHNVPTPGQFLGTNYIKLTISGNSDPTMNKHWYGYPTGATTLRLYNSFHGTVGCVSAGGFGSITIRGVSYAITNDGGSSGGTGYLQLVVSSSIPSDMVPGELLTMAGGGASCAQNRQIAFLGYAILSPLSTHTFNIADLANSVGTGGTAVINSEQGVFNPLYDYQQSSQRMESLSQQAIYLAAQGNAGARAYQSGSIAGGSTWVGSWPNDNSPLGYQESPIPYTNVQVELQKPWWEISAGLNLLKNRPSLFLTTKGPAPWIAPGPPYVISESTKSASLGNTLVVWNVSEIPQTVSVPLGTFCQIGTNPISVYKTNWPQAAPLLLTGAQTNYSTTLAPGELDTFACHPNATSYVVSTPISVTPPGGTATIAIQTVNNSYSQPLSYYTSAATTGASSPVSVPIDTGWSDTWYQATYLDSGGNVIGQDPLVKIPANTPPSQLPIITTTSPLPNATLNVTYSTTLSATNGPITWAISSGALPIGLSLAPSTGVISGTPTGAGTTFGIAATNASGSSSSTFTINVLSAPTITSASPLASGQISVAYSNQLMATGTSPITWTVTSGALPNGLSLSSGGLISGIPGVVGSNTFGVTATNSVGSIGKTFTLAINPAPATAPTITSSSPLPGGTQNVAYSTTIAVTGTSPITCTVTSGSLPTGLSLGSSNCIISGIPTGSGASSFTVTASNSVGSNAKIFSLTITAAGVPPVITSLAPLPPGIINTPYSTTILASGSTPITWALVVGALPVGFSLNTSTGIISGTTSTATSYGFTLSATNSAGSTQQAFILPISSGSGTTINGSVILNGNIAVH